MTEQNAREAMEVWITALREYTFKQNHNDPTSVIAAKLAEKDAEIAELRAFRDRVLAATAFMEPTCQHARDEAITADLLAGLSLRKCAAKHGATVAIVRGIARQALKPERPDHD